MSGHVFHEIYLHITWHTKHSLPLLQGRAKTAVKEFLRQRCEHTRGVYLHGIGGTNNHIHLAVSIEPFVSISDLVGDLKGSCSHEINSHKGEDFLYWQRGYGVVSFGKKQLPFILDYIANQETHHAENRVYRRLEQSTTEEPPPQGGV